MRARRSDSLRIVVTRTPLGVTLAGASTPLSERKEFSESVFSVTIDKYIYVTVKRHSKLFNEPIRINYSSTELVENIDAIRNHVARESLRLLNIDPPIYISTTGDIPASVGLAGSSSFAVGLLHALHALRDERVSPGQLAEEAAHLQIDVLKEPVGKHDPYAAAFGGLNLFRFGSAGEVTFESMGVHDQFLDELFRHILLFWTGLQEGASPVPQVQPKESASEIENLNKLQAFPRELLQLAQASPFDPVGFGRILTDSWQLERRMTDSIGAEIDAYFQRAIHAGAEGGRFCGAGHTGFLLLLIKPENQPAVRQALSDLQEVPIGFEVHGSRVLLPFER